MLPKSNIQSATPVIPLINVGAGLDIMTGVFVKGRHGEHLLLGGLGPVTGMTGKGNSYKTTAMKYMVMSAADRMASTSDTHVEEYDTEFNQSRERARSLSQAFPSFVGKDIANDGSDEDGSHTWNLTNPEKFSGNKWFDALKKYLEIKHATKEAWVHLPFIDKDKKPIKMLIPTFSIVDSFTRFETDDVIDMQEKAEIGHKDGNTIHMRQGLSKLRFLMEAPILSNKMFNYLLLSAHLGKEGPGMQSGPYAPPPEKKIPHMKPGDKLKGVTDQFFYLTTNFWQASSTNFANKETKSSEYPKDENDVPNESGLCDLNLVTLKLLRTKFGPSGTSIDIAVSQRDGVLPSLTEYLICKGEDKFGIEGNDRNYYLTLYEEAKLSRTTIRKKFDADAKLRRAMNITSELCQMRQFYRTLKPEVLEPAAVLKGIRERGYDWDFILSSTRGWWTIHNDAHPLYFLSTMDIALMSVGEYHPYWLEDDKKTIKKEYLQK
jgi:hypothetical protein